MGYKLLILLMLLPSCGQRLRRDYYMSKDDFRRGDRIIVEGEQGDVVIELGVEVERKQGDVTIEPMDSGWEDE